MAFSTGGFFSFQAFKENRYIQTQWIHFRKPGMMFP